MHTQLNGEGGKGQQAQLTRVWGGTPNPFSYTWKGSDCGLVEGPSSKYTCLGFCCSSSRLSRPLPAISCHLPVNMLPQHPVLGSVSSSSSSLAPFSASISTLPLVPSFHSLQPFQEASQVSRAPSKCRRKGRSLVVQSLSCIRLWNPMDCSMPGFPVFTISRSLFKLMSIESVMPSNHLILCRPLLLLPSIFPSISLPTRKGLALSSFLLPASSAFGAHCPLHTGNNTPKQTAQQWGPVTSLRLEQGPTQGLQLLG